MKKNNFQYLGEQLPRSDQFTLVGTLRGAPDFIARQLIEDYLELTECSCAENINEQIWNPSGRGSFTTQPVPNCLHCWAETLTDRRGRLRWGFGRSSQLVEITAVANHSTSPRDRTAAGDRRGGSDSMNR